MQHHRQNHYSLQVLRQIHPLTLQKTNCSKSWPCRQIRHRSTLLAWLRLSIQVHCLITPINTLHLSTCTLVPTTIHLPFPSKTIISLIIWIINIMATRLNPTVTVEGLDLHRQRARMGQQGQRMERRNRISVRYVREDSQREGIFNVIREYTLGSRLSCVPSLDVRLGQAGRTISNNSTSSF